MGSPHKTALAREWVHSHEEDQGDTRVFRPASYVFPPSRGRERLDLREGGELMAQSPGPDDRSTRQHGSWSFDGRELRIEQAGSKTVLKVQSVSPDKLVVSR